jgi:hypothetical protein
MAQTTSDTSPQSATGGDLPRLDQIAALIRSLTYGEMCELATELWNSGDDWFTALEKTLPETLHKWAVTHGRK